MLTIEQIKRKVEEIIGDREVSREEYPQIAAIIHPVVDYPTAINLQNGDLANLFALPSTAVKRAAYDLTTDDWLDMLITAVATWQNYQEQSDWLKANGKLQENHEG